MPLFKCSACGARENTALSNWAVRVCLDKQPPLCSECDPEIGAWHGQFPKEPWNEERDGPHDIERMRR